MATINSKG